MTNHWMRGAAFALALAPAAALAEGKAALIIGNSEYEIGPKALSAERDTEAVAGALEEAGYAVTYLQDLDRQGMRDAMTGFVSATDNSDQVVIYYSGHAIRMDGQTYLAPVEFSPSNQVAAAMDGVSLSALLGLASRKPGAAIVFLDAAQLDGFAPSDYAEPGLADFEPPEGVLIVSAAAPGRAVQRSRWRNSGFAGAILDDFLAEGAEAMDVVDRLSAPIWSIGWVDSDLTIAPLPEPEPVAAAGGSDISQQIELAFWQSTEAAGTKADYEAYLRRYPNGLFADIARNRIGAAPAASASQSQTATTTATAPAAPRARTAAELAAEAEADLSLTRTERRRIQADLTALGYDTRGIDGIFGRATRGAVRTWQTAEDYRSTGYLTRPQIVALRETAAEVIAEREREQAERARLSAAEAAERDEADWNRARAVGTTAAYQRYLAANPEGKYADEAKRILADARADEDARTWAEAERLNNREAYAVYLDKFPDGRNAVEAQRRYDLLGDAKAVEDTEAEATASAEAEAAYKQAVAEDTPSGYAAFIESYPDSPLVAEAENRRLAILNEQRVEREDRLGLTLDDWATIQKQLATAGFRPGNRQGDVTERTRRAIRDYRRSRGLSVHGYADKKFLRVLKGEAG